VTVSDLSCDICGRYLPGPGSGVRFVYHPGVPELRDDSGLACAACWNGVTRGLDPAAPAGRCAACGDPAARRQSLHMRRFDDPRSWRLCRPHAVAFLNSLRTVEPKLDPATFRFPAAGAARG
jgi:hypothetical protein